MAAAKKGPGLAIVFGGASKPGASGDEAAEHDEAKQVLVDSLKDSGMDEDAAHNVVDAMHQYILACMHAPPASEKAEEDEEEGY